MARVLQIEDYTASNVINLLDSAAVCIFTGEIDARPMKSDDSKITRVFGFRVQGATKAIVRTSANTFITSLRKALIWNENVLKADSWFLREAADGETVFRSLITNFEATSEFRGTAVDPYQTKHVTLHLKVALTLQNHREAIAARNLTLDYTTTNGAIGNRYVLSTTVGGTSTPTTDRSRMTAKFTADGTGGGIRKFWCGIMPSPGLAFQPIWQIYNGTPAIADTTVGSPAADVFSTNAVGCTFATSAAMVDRMTLRIDDNYASAADAEAARGIYYVLARCRVNGTGTVLMRLGQSGGDVVGTAYNETRLLVSDTKFHHVPMGVMQFPARSYRALDYTGDLVSGINVKIAAQRLSGTATLTLDALVMIPYDHFIALDTQIFSTTYELAINTHENLETVAYQKSSTGAFTGYSKITEIKDWLYPASFEGSAEECIMVIAGEHLNEQLFGSTLTRINTYIYDAYEAYHV